MIPIDRRVLRKRDVKEPAKSRGAAHGRAGHRSYEPGET